MSRSNILVPIDSAQTGCVIDLRYAGPDNVTGEPIYARSAAFLHPDAARALDRVAEGAARLGLRLRIFDAFRPVEAQWALWRRFPDPEFVADPRRGSPHSRGAAVDLTLIGEDGEDLDMGTGFDAFTPASHHGSDLVSKTAQRNRLLLLGLMTGAGFDWYENEWWHYQLPDARVRYPLLTDRAAGTDLMG